MIDEFKRLRTDLQRIYYGITTDLLRQRIDHIFLFFQHKILL
jgi:hypothetical protein